MAVLGMDACPGGWVGARVDGTRVSWHVGGAAELVELHAEVVGIDIPIGLPEGAARRTADVDARRLLGPQRSSVFLTPPRVVLGADDHAAATALSRAAGSTGVSVQTFHILRKVAEVDALLQTDRGLRSRLVEVHPELSLRRLGGQPLPPKRSAAGLAARLAVLRTWLPELVLPAPLPGRARADDCLDAVAAAWSADRWERGVADVLGGELDGRGLPMRIVV